MPDDTHRGTEEHNTLCRGVNLKVLFVAYDRPHYSGGPIVNLHRLLPELVRRGHEVSLLLLYAGSHSSAKIFLESHGVCCVAIREPTCTETSTRWILDHAEQLQPDIFVPNVSIPAHFAARWIKEAGIPTVGVIRSIDPFYAGIEEEFLRGDEQWRLSGIVCVSPFIESELQLRSVPIPMTVIPSGVPVTEKPAARWEPLRVIYVGRMEEIQKRISLVLASMEEILLRRPDVICELYGDGSQASFARTFAQQSKFNARMEFLGTVPENELTDRIGQTSIVLLLSDYEGTPGALMDAMSQGVVPICRDIPGFVPHLVEANRNGVLVEADPNAVADAVDRLADSPELWQQLSRAAHRTIVKRFSLAHCADRWEEFAKELVEATGSMRKPFVSPAKIILPPPNPNLKAFDRRRMNLVRRLRHLIASRIG